MYRRLLVSSFGALLLAAGGIASAQDAYTARPMNLRAGPDRGYPMVEQLDAGSPLDVHGCLDSWSWCDVSAEDGTRGWLYAGGISFVYEGGRVPVYTYGPQLGLPIITFSIGTYWGDYYRGRPWYAQRTQWEHRNFPPPPRHAMAPRGARPPASHAPMPRGSSHAPMSHERPSSGGRPQARPEEQGHGARPEEQGHAAPRTETPRPEEHGHAAQPGRMGGQPQHAPAARQKGPPPSSHGRSSHGEKQEKHPPQ